MRTSPDHPQCNGQVKHFNQTLVTMVKLYLKGRQKEWDRNLGGLVGAYCVTPHENTGITLNLLMLGMETWLPIEVILGSGGTSTWEQVTLYGKYIDGLRDQIQRVHDVARQYLGRNVVRMKESYDMKCSLTHYKPGDLIMHAMVSGQLDIAFKLRVNFQGPNLVLDRLGDLDYWVQLDVMGKQKAVHHDKLRPHEGEQGLPWAMSILRAHE